MRDGDKILQRTLLNLGRLFDVEPGDWPILCQCIDSILSGLISQAPECFEQLAATAQCIADRLLATHNRVKHSLHTLLTQRVCGLMLGDEDLNDHDELRHNPLLALMAGHPELTGAWARCRKQRGDGDCRLAGLSTLNRLELGGPGAASNRYQRIEWIAEQRDWLLVDGFIESCDRQPKAIWLDLDATDDPLHGDQQRKFFHGDDGHDCYLPLSLLCGEHLLCARLREASVDPAAGNVEEWEPIVKQMRTRWPDVPMIIRGDAGVAREAIMAWCERNDVDDQLGLSGHPRWVKQLEEAMAEAVSNMRPPRNRRDASGHATTAPTVHGVGSDVSSAKRTIWPEEPTHDPWQPRCRQSMWMPGACMRMGAVPAGTGRTG